MRHICKNCGTEYEGNYCHQCGQKAKVGKLTLRSVVDNWAYGLTNCDTGILFTFKELFTRPGHMLADYIGGKRIIHFQPFPMLFITAGLYSLVSEILIPVQATESVSQVQDVLSFWDRFFNLLEQWAESSMSLIAILTLPFLAWASRLAFYAPSYRPYTPGIRNSFLDWIYYHTIPPRKKRSYNYALPDYRFITTLHIRNRWIFRKYPHNFTEYIFIYAYIACQRLILGLFIGIPIMVYTHTDELSGYWAWGMYSLYFITTVWDLKQLFRINIWKAGIKTALMFFYCAMLIILFTVLASIIIIAIIYILALLKFLPVEVLEALDEAFS